MTPAERRSLWLAERRKSLGASDVASILGIEKTPWAVWASKVIGWETPDDLPMRCGRFLEPLVAELVAEKWEGEATLEEVAAGIHSSAVAWTDDGELHIIDPDHPDVARALGIIRPPGNEWAHASPDRFVLLPGRDTPGVLQIKTSRSAEGWGPDGADATADTVPPQYLVQTLWEMWCVAEHFAPFTPIPEVPIGWVAVLIGNYDLRVYPVAWDAARMAEVIATCRAWWQRHIVEGAAPTIDASRECAHGLAWLVPEPKPERIELPEAAGDLVTERERWLSRAAEAQRNADLCRNKLLAALGDSGKGLCWADGKRKLVTRRGQSVSVSSVHPDSRATAGEVDYSDAIPLGPFGEE